MFVTVHAFDRQLSIARPCVSIRSRTVNTLSQKGEVDDFSLGLGSGEQLA